MQRKRKRRWTLAEVQRIHDDASHDLYEAADNFLSGTITAGEFQAHVRRIVVPRNRRGLIDSRTGLRYL